MRIGKEEIFGPVLSVFKWSDEDTMLDRSTGRIRAHRSIWTNDLSTAHRPRRRSRPALSGSTRSRKHFLGAPFGGYKQSGVGREEWIEELLSFTREKNIHVNLKRRGGH